MKLSRNARKLVALTLSAALVLGGTAVNGSSASAAKKATLKLSRKSAKLTVGKKLTLKVKKKNVKSAKITWKSSKKAVASVSKKGVVKAKKAGKAKISAVIKYKAKGSKKTKKKTLKCTVTVTKKAVAASKAPVVTKKPEVSKAPVVPTPTPGGEDPTPTPGTEDPTPTPGTENPTPTPGTEAPTPTPGTEDPTPTPGTESPTPTPGGETTNPTPVPQPVQSLKISVKDGETVLKDAVVTIKDAADQAVAATKGEDGTYTTDKLVAGKYTIQVAELATDAGKYTPISKEVNIAESPASEVQEVVITMMLTREDVEIYTSTAGLKVDSGYKPIQPGYKYKDGYTPGKWDADIEPDTGNEDNKAVTYNFSNISSATFKITYTLEEGISDAYYFQMNGKDLTLLKEGDAEKAGTIAVDADINLLQSMAGDGINFGGRGIFVHKITITVKERYEGAYMHMFVGDEVKDQMTGILANGQYTFTFTSDTPVTITEEGWNNRKALYIKCYDALPAGVRITVDKVTMDNTEYSGAKLPAKLYADGEAKDIVSTLDLKKDGAIWYNGWDNPVTTAPDGFTATEISQTSITITVTGFPEN